MMPTFSLHMPVPRPSYTQARENLVRAIPSKLLCLLACGGRDCRYEGPECWKANQQAIRGLFSSWVTDDIVAMARPSNHLIEKYDIVEQFQRLNIRSVINMQLPGEHGHCGPTLDPTSGFTYSPQVFMDNGIYFYNFGMPDFGVSSLVGIIDGVKVLAFAVRQGRVAVHCHAGLGRTGVLIACYLIYTLRVSPSEAVHYVRVRRPRSIQTRSQISQVFDFARLLATQLVQYPDLRLRHGAPFSLQHYLNRQALLLHGQEARTLRHTPKVVYLLCVRLSCLALGLAAPPEVLAELEKRSAIRTLSTMVRETLVSNHYLHLLREDHKGSWAGSVSSWDEPLVFSERKREVLSGKRSYSDSDLSKIAVLEDAELSPHWTPSLGGERHWCVQDLIGADPKPVSHIVAALSPDQKREEFHTFHISATNTKTTESHAKRSNTALNGPVKFKKYCSNAELCRNSSHPRATSAARVVAKAMGEQGPAGEAVLQKSALLQEPVLSAQDVERLSCKVNHRKPFSVLKKPQRHTMYCLLSCISTVTSLCPHREEAVLQRLVRALTRRPLEEIGSLAALAKVLKSSLTETSHSCTHLTRTRSTTATL
ncbi:protein tyrosine phosphatase domain-containing protein 1 isoform X2 [Nelusetta ayraudi]|uniref:protein tyrosine phosphatase domain-containing protein 1 isoform X2 n=1 Tax=Nelusetta ayraudi TaxID=303726 RepID=UPI003F6E9FC0